MCDSFQSFQSLFESYDQLTNSTLLKTFFPHILPFFPKFYFAFWV